jgi:hypothetical protein
VTKRINLKSIRNRILKTKEKYNNENYKLMIALLDKYPKIKSFTINNEEHYDDNNYYKEYSIGCINGESFGMTQSALDDFDSEWNDDPEEIIGKLVIIDMPFDDFSDFASNILGWVDEDILLSFSDSYAHLEITKELIQEKLKK